MTSIVWAPGDLRVFIEGVRSPETQRLDTLFDAEFGDLAARLLAHGRDKAGQPPIVPGHKLLLDTAR